MSASTCTPSRLARSYAPGSRTGSATTTGSARLRPWRGVRPTRPTASWTRPDWRPDNPRDHLSYAAKLSGQTGPPQARVGPAAIVEGQVSSDRRACVADGVVGPERDLPVLDRAPQPLDEDVVPPGALAVHADGDPSLEQHPREVVTG